MEDKEMRARKNGELINAADEGDTDRVEQLLKEGADIETRAEHGWTPLHYAARSGHPETVQALLRFGARINVRSSFDQTPLFYTCWNGHPECAEVLLWAGADTEIRDYQGDTAEMKANGNDMLMKVFQKFKEVQPKVVDGLLTINLRGKDLSSFPGYVFKNIDLECLDLSKNRLTSIPEKLGLLKRLRKLHIDNNQLEQLPEAITTLANLEELYMSNNRLTSIPENIGQLQKLHILCIDNNQLEQPPQAITTLANLKKLYMGNWAGGAKPSPVPEGISNLKNLRVLNLMDSELDSLPNGVGKLVRLEELSIASNNFTSVPAQVTNLINLKKLDMSDNGITRLPNTIVQLAKVTDLNLDENPLAYPPRGAKKHAAAIMKVLKKETESQNKKMKEKEGKRFRKRCEYFSQKVTEQQEVDDLREALELSEEEMTVIKSEEGNNPSLQADKVLLKWIEKDKEATLEKLELKLKKFGMDRLAGEVSKIKKAGDSANNNGTEESVISQAGQEGSIPDISEESLAFLRFITKTTGINLVPLDDKEAEMQRRKKEKEWEMTFSSDNTCSISSEADDLIHERKKAVCKIEWPGGCGSGFLIGMKEVMTNDHVYQGILHAAVTNRDRTKYKATFFVSGSEHTFYLANKQALSRDDVSRLDYAILELETKPSPDLMIPLGPFISPITDTTHFVVVVGHPFGGPKRLDYALMAHVEDTFAIHMTFGSDARLDMTSYQTHSMYKGSSGSPGFDQHGNVILLHTKGVINPSASHSYSNHISVIEQGNKLTSIVEHARSHLGEETFYDLFPQYMPHAHDNSLFGRAEMMEVEDA